MASVDESVIDPPKKKEKRKEKKRTNSFGKVNTHFNCGA
jgi:hypothetical protein